MDSTGFTGFAIFVVLAVVTGTIGYLAVQQAKLKREIEESRRQRERDELAVLGGIDPTSSSVAPVITPGDAPGSTLDSTPTITPGSPLPSPHHAPPPPDTSGHDGGSFDAGGGHQ